MKRVSLVSIRQAARCIAYVVAQVATGIAVRRPWAEGGQISKSPRRSRTVGKDESGSLEASAVPATTSGQLAIQHVGRSRAAKASTCIATSRNHRRKHDASAAARTAAKSSIAVVSSTIARRQRRASCKQVRCPVQSSIILHPVGCTLVDYVTENAYERFLFAIFSTA